MKRTVYCTSLGSGQALVRLFVYSADPQFLKKYMQKNRLTVGWVQLLLGADEEQIFCQNILFLTTVFFCIYGNYSTEELMFNNVIQSPLLYFSPTIILCAIPCSQHLTLFFLPWMKALLIGSGLHTWLPSTVSVHQSAVAWAVLCIPYPLPGSPGFSMAGRQLIGENYCTVNLCTEFSRLRWIESVKGLSGKER